MYDRGFSGQIPEAGNRRPFSTDTLLLEYPTYGTGDYRTEALRVVDGNGGYAADLRFDSYEIFQGKYHLDGLPAMYADEEEADTLVIRMKDEVMGLVVNLYYGVYKDLDVITRAAVIENGGDQSIRLEKAASACLEFYDHDFDLINFHGKHAMERELERCPLRYGSQTVGSVRGGSSHQQNPFIILCDKHATEDSGECYAMSFVYSGNFLGEVEVDQVGQSRMVMGIHPTQFNFLLDPKDQFVTPEVVMSYSEKGLGSLSQNYHLAFREHLCRGKFKHAQRPVLINNWEATYFDFDEEKLFHIASEAKKLGVDLFVMDDGWFGKRENDTSGLGDWVVNEKKLKGGLGKLVERVNGLDMKFGIWFEPEAVSEDSNLYRSHPDWCLQVPGREPNRSRFQLMLDLSSEEVREYLFTSICKVLDSANIEYVKWDMNRSLSDVWSSKLPAERQGEVPHRYVLGLYELMDKLVERYPNILFEGCSGGGGRFDAGILYYMPQIWCSDNTDAIERLYIQYGTSFGYPISSVGSHVSVCPNHQTGRTTPLYTRAVTAMAGSFGYELDVSKMTEKEKTEVKEEIQKYKEYQDLVYFGIYDRLSNPYEKPYCAWQFTDVEKKKVLFNYVLMKKHANEEVYYLKLRSLNPNARYIEKESGHIYSGAALMYAGIPMPRDLKEYDAIQLYFEQV